MVARLIGEYPKLTDQEVVSRLREDYNCFIARRTVAYHRGKRLRRNKRRKPAADTRQVLITARNPLIGTHPFYTMKI